MTTETLLEIEGHIDSTKEVLHLILRRLETVPESMAESGYVASALHYLRKAEEIILTKGTKEIRKIESGAV